MLFLLVIQHAVAVALEIRVCNLASEFLTHALVLRRTGQPARAITACLLQPLLDVPYDLLILVESNLHRVKTSLPDISSIRPGVDFYLPMAYNEWRGRVSASARPMGGNDSMFSDCHIHMVLDGVYYRAAIDAHKGHVRDDLIRACLEKYAQAGITYLRDGGDAFGVCQRARELAPEYGIEYRIPCFPICLKGRYGGFIGRTFETMSDFRALVAEVARGRGDFIKIMISGLMDFDRYGVVTSQPLTAAQIREMIHIAHGEGFSVMAHANGAETVLSALEAGVDSVEHGAYMDEDTVQALAGSDAVWVPTLSTVGNLIGNGRYPDEVLMRILEGQLHNIAECARLGGHIALGSDAGAYCVFHADAVGDEYALLRRALEPQTDPMLTAGEAQIRRRFKRHV